MAREPHLSVVIPTRDTRALTLACLDSLMSARSPVDEVLLVDDGSGDGTAAAVRERHPTVRVLRHEDSHGFSRSANQGLSTARGDLLLLLNSDTEVEPESLVALLQAFESAPRLGIVGGNLHYPDGRPQWSGGPAPNLPWLFALASGIPALLAKLPGYRRRIRPLATREIREVDWVTGAALALRRDAWEQIGPLDEEFRFYGQDLELCTRGKEAGWRVAIVPGFRVMHHHGATIEHQPGAARSRDSGTQNPELLWTDLYRWAQKQRGPRWARRAGRALRWGAGLRIAGRRLRRLYLNSGARSSWDRDTIRYRRAWAAVRELEHAPGP